MIQDKIVPASVPGTDSPLPRGAAGPGNNVAPRRSGLSRRTRLCRPRLFGPGSGARRTRTPRTDVRTGFGRENGTGNRSRPPDRNPLFLSPEIDESVSSPVSGGRPWVRLPRGLRPGHRLLYPGTAGTAAAAHLRAGTASIAARRLEDAARESEAARPPASAPTYLALRPDAVRNAGPIECPVTPPANRPAPGRRRQLPSLRHCHPPRPGVRESGTEASTAPVTPRGGPQEFLRRPVVWAAPENDPLRGVWNRLRIECRAATYIDHRAPATAVISGDRRVTVPAVKATLAGVLTRTLRAANPALAWTFDEGVLIVSTQKALAASPSVFILARPRLPPTPRPSPTFGSCSAKSAFSGSAPAAWRLR